LKTFYFPFVFLKKQNRPKAFSTIYRCQLPVILSPKGKCNILLPPSVIRRVSLHTKIKNHETYLKMRKALCAAAVTLLTVATQAQIQKLEGNGKLVTRDVAVQPFHTLKAGGGYQLELQQGNNEGVKIEADENLQELFHVKNDGGKLTVEMKTPNNTSLNTKNKMKVYVTFKDLKQLDINTVGHVKSAGQLSFADLKINNQSVGNVALDLNASKLHVSNRAVGNLKLSGKVQEAVFVNNAVGNLDAGSLVVQTADVDNSGIGSVEVNAAKGLNVKQSALGKVKNKGTAPVRKKDIVVL